MCANLTTPLQGTLPGGGAPRLAEHLLGLQGAKYPPDGITDSAAVAIVAAQRPDGSWRSNEIQHRPPITQSPFSATAKIIRVLQHYAIPASKQEFAQTIERTRIWVKKAKATLQQDFTM